MPKTGNKPFAPLLDLTRIRVVRGNRTVVSDANVTVQPGEIVGFLGPNGAGKSTTILALTGLIPLAGGQITILGHSGPADAATLARIGVQPENGGFYEWMSGEAYLSWFARLYGVAEPDRRAAELMHRVRLAPQPGQPIHGYSRGMKQRLGLARALVSEPELLILDEPTNGLDPRGRRDVHDILLELADEGVGILMSTHILDDVERLCRSVSIIAGGRSVAAGPLDELLAGAAGDRFELMLGASPDKATLTAFAKAGLTVTGQEGNRVFVTASGGGAASEHWRRLLGGGVPVIEIRRLGTGLEDFYLTVTETPEKEIAA